MVSSSHRDRMKDGFCLGSQLLANVAQAQTAIYVLGDQASILKPDRRVRQVRRVELANVAVNTSSWRSYECL